MTEGAILVWSLWSNIQGMDPKLQRSLAYSRNYRKAGVSEADMGHIVADACILVWMYSEALKDIKLRNNTISFGFSKEHIT